MYKKSRVSFNSTVDFPRFTSVLFRVFLLTISGQVYDKDTRISFCSFSPRFLVSLKLELFLSFSPWFTDSLPGPSFF